MSLEHVTQALYKRKETDVAVLLLETFAKHAWQFEEYDDLAKCYFKMKRYLDAIKYGELTLTTAYTNEKMWVARANLINTYNHANFPEKAMKLIEIQERVIPDDQDNRLEKAFSYFLLNDLNSAEKILQEELLRDDLKDEVRTKIEFNLGTYNLWRDEFQQGLRRFLLEGEKLNYWRKAKLPLKFWSGGIEPGKTIILYAEAGIGDEIINVRFMKHLEEKGMQPIWFTERKDLVEIFNNSGFSATSDISMFRNSDAVWTYPMSLPVYMELEYKDLWYGPYLKTLIEYDDKQKLPATEKMRIGIRWQGNPEYDHDLHRSVPLNEIYEQLKHLDADFYSLQRDTGLEELEEFPEIVDLSDRMTTFKDTLSLIDQMDLVVTSCTSVAHAAAALGKETIVFTPISAYYTWSYGIDRCPWYGDNLTLLRQTKPRRWDDPINILHNIVKDRYEILRSTGSTTPDK